MKRNESIGIIKTNFWKNEKSYISKRTAQSYLDSNHVPKVSANSECMSGCNTSCGTSCATGCSDF